MINEFTNKNILFITHHYLSGVGGSVFASRAFINVFSELFQGNMTLLYPASSSHGIEGIDHRVESIPVYDNSTKIQNRVNLLTGRVHRFRKSIINILSERKYDIVVFDNSRVSYKMIDIVHGYDTMVVTIHHNCELEYIRDNSSRLSRPFNLLWTKKYEGEAARKSDLSLVLTPEDKVLLIEKYRLQPKASKKIQIFGVFESECKKLPEIQVSQNPKPVKKFIITGNLGDVQSNRSILQWLKIYYPILMRVIPDVKLTIAGKNPTNELICQCGILGIELIPSPPSMQPLLERSDCYICPTSLGGGLKLRIMDGLKNGLPVITHAVSARGYHNFVAEGMVCPYSSEAEFISSCERIKSVNFSKKDIQNLYKRNFSFQSGLEKLRAILLTK